MRTSRVQDTVARNVLTGMIVDQTVCSRIATEWDGDLFGERWLNIIGQWCIEHFQAYDQPPKDAIQSIFQSWAETNGDKGLVSLIGNFLDDLSDEWEEKEEETNSDFLVNQAAKYFTQVKLERLKDGIEGDLAVGNVEQARDRVSVFGEIRMSDCDWTDPLRDEETAKEVLTAQEDEEVLINYGGAIGEFYGNSLCRESFLAYMGPEKRGKTFWLIDNAIRAVLNRKRVAFFEAGDMSRRQILKRQYSRIAKVPIKPGEYRVPVEIAHEDRDEPPKVSHEIREEGRGLRYAQYVRAARKILKKRIQCDSAGMRLTVWPSDLSIGGIHSTLNRWESEGWVPDVVVVDYADLVHADNTRQDKRDQINEVWQGLRGISLKYHCLVLTATQTDAASYKTNVIGREHFSEDKRKFAHVTGFIGLNQTHEEKERGLMRLNWVLRREADYVETRCVWLAYCLPLANMAVKSCW